MWLFNGLFFSFSPLDDGTSSILDVHSGVSLVGDQAIFMYFWIAQSEFELRIPLVRHSSPLA